MGLLPVDLSGCVAVVTGAAGGLGRRMAEALHEQGAAVGLIDADPCMTEVANALDDRARAAVADVTDEAAVAAALHNLRELGPAGIVVTAAGILIPGSFQDLTSADWDRLYRVNVHGSALVTRLALPDMLTAGTGRIVLLSSALAFFSIRQRSAYAATKAAIQSLARSLAVEFGAHGITANAIAPRAVVTDLKRKLVEREPELYRPLIEGTPVARLCTADDVANAMLWLVSDQASFVSGATHPLDGGFIQC